MTVWQKISSIFTGCVLAFCSIAEAEPERPNVILIMCDDLGYGDVSCYRGADTDLPTPNIDALAESGARFTDFYVTASTCTPSRYSLLTGRQPDRGNMFGAILHTGTGRIPEGEVTVAELLRKSGYHTSLIGKWHLGHSDPTAVPSYYGFDHFYGHLGGLINYYTHTWMMRPDWQRNGEPLEEEGYATDLITDEAIRMIQNRDEKPFFIYIPYNAPHYAQKMQEEKVVILQAKPEDEAEFKHITDDKRRVYNGMVKAIDDGVGRILATLESEKVAKNTVVIFLSDHGGETKWGGNNEPLYGKKHTSWEGGLRVPFIIRWPGRIEPGSTRSSVCSTMDLLPTLCRQLGASSDGLELDGIDISPVLFENKTIERDLFWSYKGGAFRRGKWKLYNGKLYDLEADLQERNDLAKQHPEKYEEMVNAFNAEKARFQALNPGGKKSKSKSKGKKRKKKTT